MKAVEFNVTIPGYLMAKGLGRLTDAVVYGGLSGVRMVDRPAPELPDDSWVRIDVALAGICGSDLGNISFKSSPAMEPFGSFPAVLGHEIVGRVAEVGPAVTDLAVGDRVVIDPMIHCETRGYAPNDWCTACRAGQHSTCEMAGEEGPLTVGGELLSAGLTIGYHSSLPGGWGEQMIAHRRQVFTVPEELDDQVAVLAEPLAIGVHAVISSRALDSAGPVLVIGSGTIAFATIWALRTLGYGGEIIAQAKRPHEIELAKRLGANRTVTPGDDARQALVDTGARAYMPIVGDEVYSGGGFDVIFDCVGTGSSIPQSLRFAAPRGQVILLGCAAEIKKLDLTFVWAREIDVQGCVGYGDESWQGERRHTFDITLERMAADPTGLDQLVTHVFPLHQYRGALHAAYNHRSSKAVKVVLKP